IIFDFDSTLIKGESLELILEPLLADDTSKILEIEKITNMGMSGDIDFKTSLERRLAIAKPTLQAIKAFSDKYCPSLLTKGMVELVSNLQEKGYEIWIFSGGLTDSIKPFAEALGISTKNIYAVEVDWNADGSFNKLNNSNGACDSKLEAFDKAKELLRGEVIAIGDGYTDYQLFESGLADKFIAYTEHVTRENVVAKAESIAMDVGVLKYI
ncbi:hypothetical protein EGW08_022884, partial [Elysia chlorotica]